MSALRSWDDRTGLPLLISRLIVGVTFLWLGVDKTANPVTFLKLIREYDIVPEGWSWLLNGMAVTLPWIEIVCGLALLLGISVRGGALVAGALLVAFTGAILIRALAIHATGPDFCSIAFDCGCGSGEEFVCVKLPQNLGLIVLCGVAIWSRSSRYCLARDLVR